MHEPSARAFYEQAAVAAASMGVVVDVFAAARGFVGLTTLEPLANSTGGVLHLYPSAEEATLPQDLHRCAAAAPHSVVPACALLRCCAVGAVAWAERLQTIMAGSPACAGAPACAPACTLSPSRRRLSAPKGHSGMLRLRCCPQVRPSRCYGRLYQDSSYSDLFHVPCCDAGQAFVFDLEHVGPGVYNERFRELTLQAAFQYSRVVPAAAAGAGAGAGTAGGRSSSVQFVVERRLRVCTVRCATAAAPGQAASHCPCCSWSAHLVRWRALRTV